MAQVAALAFMQLPFQCRASTTPQVWTGMRNPGEGAHRFRAGMIRPASLQCGSCPGLELDNKECIQDAPPRNIGRGQSRALQLSEDSLMLNV
jgi:hypothetical protein